MYSRPTAFGPPSQATWPATGSVSNMTGSDSAIGENHPYTPPYYYGQAWADIKFTATETKKYSIGEIIRNSTVEYYRHLDSRTNNSNADRKEEAIRVNKLYNTNAMQLSASLDLFAQGEIRNVDLVGDGTSQGVSVAVNASGEEKSRWIIQSYFETPMLNFNSYTLTGSLYRSSKYPQATPRGMWHQYGFIETDPAKGVFLGVSEIPEDFRTNFVGSAAEESLVDLCGFSKDVVRLGTPATAKQIGEAVVAIPFVEQNGRRKFFRLEKGAVYGAAADLDINTKRDNIADSIIDMVDKMKRMEAIYPDLVKL